MPGSGRFLGALDLADGNDARHIASGKTMRASKDSDGKAEHVLSAFCCGLQQLSDTRPRAARDWKFPMRSNCWSGST